MFWSKKHFQFSNIPDLSGKIAIITGSNTGIGKVCAIEMARKNCHVVVASRNEQRGNAAVEEIKAATGNDKVEFMKLDLLSLEAVKAFAEEFKSKHKQLHILMNNAGVMACPFGLSKDGIETQFATNHVAHYYLTIQLLPLLEESIPSRIVNVSSAAHNATSIRTVSLDKASDEKSYNRAIQYGFTKACNILFSRELSKRLEVKGVKDIYVNSLHPGSVQSDLYRHLFFGIGFLEKFYNTIFNITTENGALTQLYLATSPEVEEKHIKGKYYVPYAVPGNPNAYSSSEKNAASLWEFTENLLKEKIQDYQGATI
ncbi:hypothetical protein BJV82DRAFT_573441 [Fennellomyces sp. T-0311]|nr:hypothetical protein BJV82DRAFT_573441 [Fennellomyces sp. T-0311]